MGDLKERHIGYYARGYSDRLNKKRDIGIIIKA
jgi:hypothetical protein